MYLSFKKFLSFFLIFTTLFFLYQMLREDIVDFFGPTVYNCDKVEKLLIGGWHPDIPQEVVQECRKLKKETRRTLNT